jgi:flagellar protein FliS
VEQLMTYTAQARSRYTADAVQTASPARLLVMLYDRLVLDLVNAEKSSLAADFEKMSSELQHAQDIILELRTSLDVEAWDGARGLSDLYTWVYGELVAANIKRDAGRIASCRSLVEPLRDAWRQAALASLQTA